MERGGSCDALHQLEALGKEDQIQHNHEGVDGHQVGDPHPLILWITSDLWPVKFKVVQRPSEEIHLFDRAFTFTR